MQFQSSLPSPLGSSTQQLGFLLRYKSRRRVHARPQQARRERPGSVRLVPAKHPGQVTTCLIRGGVLLEIGSSRFPSGGGAPRHSKSRLPLRSIASASRRDSRTSSPWEASSDRDWEGVVYGHSRRRETNRPLASKGYEARSTARAPARTRPDKRPPSVGCGE